MKNTISAEYIACRTRTGKETHLAAATSSVTACGRWLKTSAFYFKTSDDPHTATCEKCQHTLAMIEGRA